MKIDEVTTMVFSGGKTRIQKYSECFARDSRRKGYMNKR